MLRKDVHMEEVCRWLNELYTCMEDDGLEMNRFDWDNLDKELHLVLEEFFNYPDYRNYN